MFSLFVGIMIFGIGITYLVNEDYIPAAIEFALAAFNFYLASLVL